MCILLETMGLGLECVGLGLVLGLEALSLESKSVFNAYFSHIWLEMHIF